MGPISPELAENIAREFAERIRQLQQTKQHQPYGEHKPVSENGQMNESGSGEGLQAILALEPDQLYNLLKDEHPQTIAIVLVHLDIGMAGDILALMSEDLRLDVSVRIAGLDKVLSGMVDEINHVFEEILKNKETTVTRVKGGAEKLADILNQIDESAGKSLMDQIEADNPDLAAEIKQKMFVFENLVLIDDRGFQKMLRRVETADLAVALKAASDEVKDKVFRNMSARAGEMLKEEIEDMGPVRMKDVEDAQQKIAAMVQELEAAGELIISGRGGDTMVA
jgi:flagellar motor switch protein FliG